MKAFVKRGNLPDAPAPTKPVRGFEQWEMKHYKELAEHPDMHEFKPKEKHKWTKDEIQTLVDLWMDGKSPKGIAKEMHMEIRATSNRVSYMISKGEIRKKRSVVTEEERKRIIAESQNGDDIPTLCRRYQIGESLVKRICNQK